MDPVAPKRLGADLMSPDPPDLLPLSPLLASPQAPCSCSGAGSYEDLLDFPRTPQRKGYGRCNIRVL